MAAYMLNLNIESGANVMLRVISLVCLCVGREGDRRWGRRREQRDNNYCA